MANEIPKWSGYTGNCFSCRRDFHISQQALDEYCAAFPADTESVAAKHFEVCLSCGGGRDLPGEHDFPLDVLTEAHLNAIEACLNVADPCDDIASEAVDFGPAAIHAKAMEALALLRKGVLPKSKKGTIIVVLHQGQVQDVQTDLTGEDLPIVYTLDYDTDGNTDSECLIDHTYPLSSLVDGPTATAPALCYEWPLDDPDPAAIARLESALAASHDAPITERLFRPGDEKELAEALDDHITNVPQHTPIQDWRLPPHFSVAEDGSGRLEKHRAAHGHAGTAHRIENDGGLTL